MGEFFNSQRRQRRILFPRYRYSNISNITRSNFNDVSSSPIRNPMNITMDNNENIMDLDLDKIQKMKHNILSELELSENKYSSIMNSLREYKYIDEIHGFLKDYCQTRFDLIQNVSVVYGGSVKLENCEEILSSNNVDGLLIGGASLDPETFSKIYNFS